MNNKRRAVFAALLSLLSIGLIMLTWFLIYQSIKKKEFDEILNKMILEIDSSIKSGYFEHAGELIYTAGKLADSPMEYKRLLKRARITDNPEYLLFFSKIANDKFPEDEDLKELYIYSLVRSGKSQDAFNLIEKTKSSNIPDSLKAETAIRTGEYSNTDNLFYQGLNKKSPSIFKKLFELTGDKSFLMNAVLINLNEGNLSSTITDLENIDEIRFDTRRIEFLVNFDTGNLSKASEMLDLYDLGLEPMEIKLLRIDISLMNGNIKKALGNILEFIVLYPEYSWIPYYNLIWLDDFLDVPDLEKIIDEAQTLFPDKRKLMLLIVDYKMKEKIVAEALNIVEKYRNQNPDDTELDIIRREIKGTADPGYFINTIRNLVNRNPNNVQAAKYLSWYMLDNGSIDQLSGFLDQADISGSAGWINFFRALIAAHNKDFTSAQTYFDSAYQADLKWEVLYNLGVVSEYSKNFQKAVEYYQNAENRLQYNEENRKIKSHIRTSLAALLYSMGDSETAYRELMNAIDLDKNNLKARLLLNKLDADSN